MNNVQHIPLVLPLDDDTATLEHVGGKGASLARLAAAGLPVPPGFHITTAAYRDFVEANGLQGQILEAVSGIQVDQPATLEEASSKIHKLFEQSQMPDEIAQAIRQAYAQIGKDESKNGQQAAMLPVAVRSSATAEDLPEMSFAGQQDTYLNMRGDAMVLDAVKRCWASLWTARAIGYRARHKIAPQDVSLAVVVQQLVPADAAGILFTANPMTGARDQVMINAAWGLGEAIVGGQVTPDTVVVNKSDSTIVMQQITEKDVMTVRTTEGTHEEPVPADRRNKAVLDASQAAELARIGVQIEKLYEQPMDIEWAQQNSHVYIVQARPITALPDAPIDAPAEARAGFQESDWPLPKPKGKYTRNSVIELLPDPLSPLFETLGLPAVASATKRLTADMNVPPIFAGDVLLTINDYAYYDIGFSAKEVFALIVSMPRLMAEFPGLLHTSRDRWLKARSNYAELIKRWKHSDLSTTPASDLVKGVADIADQMGRYYITIQSGNLPAAYISEMLFTWFYEKFCKGRNGPMALTFMLGFDSIPMQAEKSLYDLAQWVRQQDSLSTRFERMSHEQFLAAFHERATTEGAWREFWQRLDEHLDRFGHTIYDLDFAKPVLADDPSPVLETLKFFLSGQAPDPYKRQAKAEAARNEATRTVASRLGGFRLKRFQKMLERAQRYAPLREDGIADVGLGWPILRRMLHEIGQRLVKQNALNAPDDVYSLRYPELQEAASTLDTNQPATNYQALVAERRATWERERKLTPPTVLPIKGGANILGYDFSNFMPANTNQKEGDTLKGIGASPGTITATARVIHGPNEFDQMRQGDILVTRITTPAWTPLFALASGIVTDVGGPLSHSSIVAREYHIPAVLGTGLATERLNSGQQITVDGNTGTVTVVR